MPEMEREMQGSLVAGNNRISSIQSRGYCFPKLIINMADSVPAGGISRIRFEISVVEFLAANKLIYMPQIV